MNFKKAFQGIRREKKNSHKLSSPNRIQSNNLSGKILLHLQDLVLTFFSLESPPEFNAKITYFTWQNIQIFCPFNNCLSVFYIGL